MTIFASKDGKNRRVVQMPDAPARSLVETVAAKYAEFLECAAARDLKAPLCMDDGMCSCRRDVAFILAAIERIPPQHD